MEGILLHDVRIFPCLSSGAFTSVLPAPGSALPGAELILFCSSGEWEVLRQPWVTEWMVREAQPLSPRRHAFVSMACASWYAAVLEFKRSDCRSAEIWVIEASANFIQQRLDCAGLGRNGEGLLASGGVACISLRKAQWGERGVWIDDCALLAKPAGLRGTELLIKRYVQWMSTHLPGNGQADWISFAIETQWSRQLQAGLALWGKETLQLLVMQPSVEQGPGHYMALKPLYELAPYLQRPLVRPVILTTLAGGGRIGCALLRPAQETPDSRCRDIHPIHIPATALPADVPPRYCERAYRYHDNEYFLTELDASAPALFMHS